MQAKVWDLFFPMVPAGAGSSIQNGGPTDVQSVQANATDRRGD